MELLDEVGGEGEFALDEDGRGRAGNDTLDDVVADCADLSGIGVRRDLGKGFVDDFPGEQFGLGALRGGPLVRRVIGQVEEHF